jgi:hypothetical protein
MRSGKLKEKGSKRCWKNLNNEKLWLKANSSGNTKLRMINKKVYINSPEEKLKKFNIKRTTKSLMKE